MVFCRARLIRNVSQTRLLDLVRGLAKKKRIAVLFVRAVAIRANPSQARPTIRACLCPHGLGLPDS